MPLPLPCLDRSSVVVAPSEDGAGHWAGAPSACMVGGETYLAYRLRRPIGEGRGYAVVVARSLDGEKFETLKVIRQEEMATDSLERPALTVTPDGIWRLYLSCATPGTKHWRVEVLEAADPLAFDPVTSRVVLPGSESVGVKDPVIVYEDGTWHLWASCHPLADPDEADRMVTDYATSPDGLEWAWQGTALAGRPGEWDSRGARVTAVRFGAPGPHAVTAYYDGRASAEENYEERTGIATGTRFGALVAEGTEPVSSPHAGGGLRYVCAVRLPDGMWRLYYEATREDGAHELRTEVA